MRPGTSTSMRPKWKPRRSPGKRSAMTDRNGVVRIEIASNEEDYRNAVRLIESVIRRWYGCLPPEPPKTIVVAKHGSEVIGTSALEFSNGEEPLSIESIYEFDRARTPWPFDRPRIVQFGRWAATMKDISGVLIYASTVFALNHGKIWGVSEVKDRIAERFSELGVELRFITPAKLLLERIS